MQPATAEGMDPVLAYPAMPPEAVSAARMYEVVSSPFACGVKHF